MNSLWIAFTVFCAALSAFGFYLGYSLKKGKEKQK